MNNTIFKKKHTIIVAPLDWGLGHVTRMIPVVQWLSENNNVIVAAPKHLHLFFHSGVKCIDVNGYSIKYFNTALWFSLLIQTPTIFFRAIKTKIEARKIFHRYQPDLIISDNRPFFRSNKIRSIYITHQLSIPHSSTLIKKLVNYFHHKLIHKFDECWIPDTYKHLFAGELSYGTLKIPVRYLGGLTRFQLTKQKTAPKYKRVCILSGPEPGKTHWEKEVREKWKNKDKSLIIGALKGIDKFENHGGLVLSSHLNDDLFFSIIKQAGLVFTRSGYSSIMDLMYLRKNALLIPTPGQGEQQYLATYHDGNYFFAAQNPDDYQINLLKNYDDSIEKRFCSPDKLKAIVG